MSPPAANTCSARIPAREMPFRGKQPVCANMSDTNHPPNFAKSLRNQIGKHGVKGYYDYVSLLMDGLRFEPLHVAVVGNSHPEKTAFLNAMCRSFALGHGLSLGGSHISDSYVRVETTPIIVTESNQWLHTPSDHGYGIIRPDLLETSRGARESTPEPVTPDHRSENASISSDHADTKDISEEVENHGETKPDNGKHVRLDDVIVEDKPVVTVSQCVLSDIELADGTISRYSPSDFPQLYLWDVPPSAAHCPGIAFDAYVLMTCSGELNKSELSTAVMFRDRKDAVFLYANLDSKIRGESGEPDIVSEIETFREVRSHCRHALYEKALGSMPLFIISTSDTHKFDFPDLRRQLLRWVKRKQTLRKDTMARATSSALDTKKRRLQRYCALTATACALCTAIPQTPFFALLGDSAIYLVSLAFHRCAFGLNGLEMRDDSETNGIQQKSSMFSVLMEHVPCFSVWLARKALMAAAADKATATHNGSAKSVLSIISGAVVFNFVEGILRDNLRLCAHNAKTLVDYVINRLMPMHIREHSMPSTRASTRPSSPTPSF